MRQTALSLAQTPPLAVPMRFFLTAPLFVMAAAITLLVSGPDAVASRWTAELLAVTHFFTLGFLAMVMLGALQQLVPVLMGVAIPAARWFSMAIHVPLTLGVVALGGGWLGQQSGLFVVAVALLVAAISLFVLVLVFLIARAGAWSMMSRASVLAMLALLFTISMGAYLALGYSGGGLVRLPGMTDQHLTWGLVGWVTLLISGIAYQVIPMFQITADYPRPMMRWFAGLVFTSLLLWSTLVLLQVGGVWLVAAAGLLALELIALAVVTLYLLWHRRRRMPDMTLNFWYTAMASLLLAVALWLVSNLVPYERFALLLGVLMIIGFAVSAVSGMLYKIVPFLIWLHLNNRLQKRGGFQGRIPNMKQVIPLRYARAHFALHLLMLGLVSLAVFWPGYLLVPAALALLLTALVMWGNIIGALRLYARVLGQS